MTPQFAIALSAPASRSNLPTAALSPQVRRMGRLMVAETLRGADMMNKQACNKYTTRIIACSIRIRVCYTDRENGMYVQVQHPTIGTLGF